MDVSRHWLPAFVAAIGLLVLAPSRAEADPVPQFEEDEDMEEGDEEGDEGEGYDDEGYEEVYDDEGDEEEGGGEAVSSYVEDDEELPDEEEGSKVDEPESKIVTGTWTKSLVFATDDGGFEFQPRGWVQPRYGLTINPDADEAIAGSGFSLHRARFGFQARLFDFARLYLDTEWGTGDAKLVDYFLDVDPWDGVAVFRVGNFRPWFSRQLLMATTKLAMIDYARAWTDSLLGLDLGRDLGLSVSGLVAETFEYGIGIWNGDKGQFDTSPHDVTLESGEEIEVPGNLSYYVGGRLAVHPLAPSGVGTPLLIGDESDGAGSEKPALAIGVAAFYNKRRDRGIMYNASATTPDAALYSIDPTGTLGGAPAMYYDNQLKIGADVAFRMKGLSLQGEFYLHMIWIDEDDMPQSATEAERDMIEAAFNDYLFVSNGSGALLNGMGIGAYLQAGYFVLPGQLEIVARFDMVDESSDIQGMRLFPAIGGTYYFFGNNLKAQLMYRLNASTGYDDADPGYAPMTHDILLMIQASI